MSVPSYVPTTGQPTKICTKCDGTTFAIKSTASCPAGTKGSPVLLVYGQLSFDLPLLSVPALGSSGFNFGLSYLSGYGGLTNSDQTVGTNFNYPQNQTLSSAGSGNILLQLGENTQELFTGIGSGRFSAGGNNTAATLQQFNAGASDEYFTMTSSDGVLSTFAGINSLVTTPGRLLSFADRYGSTQTLSWSMSGSVSRLSSVTDGYGRVNNFTYAGTSPYALTQITDCLGRSVNFQYDSDGRLVAVVLPSITRSANSNGNNFPYGTAYVFKYDTANTRLARRNDLIAIYYPNQVQPYVGSGRVVDVASVLTSAIARRQIKYFQDPTDPLSYGRVQEVLESATGTGSIGAAAWGYAYQDSGLPTNTVNPADPIVSRTIEADRNGNITYWDFNANQMLVHKEVLANRSKSSLQSGSWETWTQYNSHNQKALVVNPAGDSEISAYEDETTVPTIEAAPYAPMIGLLKSVTRTPGNTFGIAIPNRPGSNGQTQLTESYFYDPIFNKQCAKIEVRGNPIDASDDFFVPQNGGTTPTLSNRSRYATMTTFDYQKDTLTTLQADSTLLGNLGITATDLSTIIGYVTSQMSAVGLSFSLGLGDINGDGTGDGTGHNANHTGATIQVQSPSVRQLAPTGSGTYPLTIQPDAPLAYWRLDEASGTTAGDSTGNSRTATYTGGYTLGATGLLQNDPDKAVTLNGTSGYVAAGNPSAFQITTGTVEAWIKTSGAGSSYRGIITKQGAWGLYLNGNVLGAYDFSSNTFQSTGVNLADGNPHHVVFTFQAGATNGSAIYIDGTLKLTFTLGSSGLSQSKEVELGNGGPTSGQTFGGTIDEAAIYNTVLPAFRVLAHYTAGSSTTPGVWQTQNIVELYTNNAMGQVTTYTNAEGNLTVYVRFPQNNPDGNDDVDDPSLGTQQYGRIKQIITDADPSTVMTVVGSYGDLITFIGNKIARYNTPGVYQSLTTSHQGTSGCTSCNYDPLGNVVTTVDARGNTTTFNRNELGEVYQVVLPDPYDFLIETSYDANRNVIQVDTQDWVVEYSSSSPSSPLYAQFTPSGSGSTADVPMTAGPGGSVRSGWFSNVYTYDLLDNKIEDDIDATGSTPSSLATTYAYDFNQNLVTITRPLLNTIEYDYDERNLRIATRVGGSSGSVTIQAYDPNGNLMDVIGPATRGTAAQTLSCVIADAFGGSSNVTYSGDYLAYNMYDGFDRLLTSTDAAGGMVLNTYDPGGRVIASQTLGSPGGATPTDRSGSSNITLTSGSTRYDEMGRPYETQRDVFLDGGTYYGSSPNRGLPSGRAVTHTGGGLAANSTTNSNTATVTLTAGGVTYALSRSVFDRLGRVTGIADDNGAISTAAYDGADRRILAADALGNVGNYQFDANGNVTGTTRTDVCTLSLTIARESFGSLMCYDVLNRLVIQANQGADGTLSGYFPTPGSATIYTIFGYDSRGNRTHLIDPRLNTTLFDFDGANRLIETDQHLRSGGVGTNAITSTVSTYQQYDANSNLSKLTDSNGGATWFYYDTHDRQTSMVFYDSSTRTYGYDAADDITSYTDENGSVFSNTFDVLGRKTAVAITLATNVVGTTAQSFQFDGASRLTFARDSVSSTNADAGFTYDSISRVLEEQQTYSGDTRYVTHNAWTSYPSTGFTFPDSRQTTSGFDALYRKKSQTETSGGASIASWQFFGNRTATVTLGNGMVTSFMNNGQTRSAIQNGLTTPSWGSISTDQLGYDGAGRLIGKRHFNGGSVLVGFTTAYDLSSNKFFERPLHAENRASLYDSYDSMNRLLDYQRGTLNIGGASLSGNISLPGTNQKQAYNLDALGNWSTTTITPEGGAASVQNRTHNLLNQITAYGVSPTSTPVYYDQGNNSGSPPQPGNGNVIDDGVRTYSYDALNRLNTVARKSDSAQIAAYAYDALGRRISKNVSNGGLTTTIPNGTSRYLLNGWRTIEELSDTTGAAIAQYMWGHYIDELIQIKALGGIGPQPLSAGDYYLLSDLLYRSAALTTSTSSVVEAYDTDAYGNTLLFRASGTDGQWFTSDDQQASWSACQYVFTGREYDAETAIYFYRARYFPPFLGRFISRDPNPRERLGNLYRYTRAAPLTFLDPAGLSEYSTSEWQTFLESRRLFAGYNDINDLFRQAAQHQLEADKENDWVWDCKSDMDNIMTALYYNYARPEGDTVENIRGSEFDPWKTPGLFQNWNADWVNEHQLRHFVAGYAWKNWTYAAQGFHERFMQTARDTPDDERQQNAAAYLGSELRYFISGDDYGEANCRCLMKKIAAGAFKFTDFFGPPQAWNVLKGGGYSMFDTRDEELAKILCQRALNRCYGELIAIIKV